MLFIQTNNSELTILDATSEIVQYFFAKQSKYDNFDGNILLPC